MAVLLLASAAGGLALTRLRVGFPDENPGWINWIAGPVLEQEWGGEGPSTGTLEFHLVPGLGPCWFDPPTIHLWRVSPGPRQNVVEYPFADDCGRARLLRVPAGRYTLGRGGGSEGLNLETLDLVVLPGERTRVKLSR